MPELWSFAILCCLECVAWFLRWSHNTLDENRNDVGYHGLASLREDVEHLRHEGKPAEACWLEIGELAPMVLPLILTLIYRYFYRYVLKAEAFATSFVAFSLGFNFLMFVASKHFDMVKRFMSVAPVAHTWQNSLANAALLDTVFAFAFIVVLVYANLTACRAAKCRKSGTCPCQMKQGRIAWCIIGYGVETTGIVVGSLLAGTVPFDIFVIAPTLTLTISILALGSSLADRSEIAIL